MVLMDYSANEKVHLSQVLLEVSLSLSSHVSKVSRLFFGSPLAK